MWYHITKRLLSKSGECKKLNEETLYYGCGSQMVCVSMKKKYMDDEAKVSTANLGERTIMTSIQI